jgi:large conductance mechanosensitive channel
MSLASEFRSFVLRGNVIDLAVAVVIGAAFGAVVTSLVENIITPLIAAIGGQPDFSGLSFTINNSVFQYGLFLNALISFLIIAAVIFLFIIKPMNSLMARFKPSATEPTPTKQCPYCMSDVPEAATRCPFCTSDLSL